MSEELKPCPFCGGEARIIAKPYEPKVCVGCDDDTCLGFSGLGWLYDSEKEATEAWNRRAERTCRMEKDDRYSEMYEGPMLRCTRCDAPVPEIFTGQYNYCPNCGGRVEV